jgi:hypothetical protein
MVDAADLKSAVAKAAYGFDSRPRHRTPLCGRAALGFGTEGKVADQGNSGVQGLLAIAHDHGWGVPRNATEAYFWANLSAALTVGNPSLAEGSPELASDPAKSGAEERNKIGAKLTRSQLLAVQKRCRQWMDGCFREAEGPQIGGDRVCIQDRSGPIWVLAGFISMGSPIPLCRAHRR